MKPWRIVSVGTALALIFAATSIGLSAPVSESEPNNTFGTADSLTSGDAMSGAISPVSDLDYFAIPGVNHLWGVIALLDTSTGAADPPGRLSMLRADGTTVLQTDSGSWEKGSGIAFGPYIDEAATHYLKVEEDGGDATIADYTLRYYPTIITTQPEVEPNESTAQAQTTSFTMRGTLSSGTDVDCYAFFGYSAQDFIFSLDGDPDGNGASFNPVLEVRDAANAVVASANLTGNGGREFIELAPLGVSDVHSYCVRAASGTGGPDAEYHVGLVRDGHLYLPYYSVVADWTNPRPGNYARIGDLMTFDLSITNADQVKIPGDLHMRGLYEGDCMSYVSSTPVATSHTFGVVSWAGQKPGGLNPSETYAVSMTMRAHQGCRDHVQEALYMSYYFTGTGENADYLIWWDILMPAVMRNAP
jgi:hypothetical protein